MSHLQTFQVFPNIPKPLSFLETLSQNIWWCWRHDAVELFRRIDPRLWDKSGRNPIAFSTFLSQKRLEELARDSSYLAHMERVRGLYENEVAGMAPDPALGPDETVAYFSMEFGIHESIPLFAGGLGILAGDHLKAASDMNLPLTGVGLLYRQGYFRQYLDAEGWQQEQYPETDFFHVPMKRAEDREGRFLRIGIESPEGYVLADVWKIQVGTIPLYLLDTNLVENPPEIRNITARLYAAEQKIRLAQEMLLGIGGMRALEAMGIHPVICHMNEGHSAFAGLERLAQTMRRRDVNLETAWEIVPRSTIFTTHTPVAAGHDEFPADLVRPFLKPMEPRLGVSADAILSWGQAAGSGPDAPLSMFVLGVRMAQYCNGVSRLHGRVARRMWTHVWPELPEDEVPISHVTNGVHIASWISLENALLCERYIGPEWRRHPSNPDILHRIDEIYDEELWRAHEMSRSRLIRTCRRQMVEQYGRRNAPKSLMREAESVLDQDILTIGFARRFATYKRAYLLLMDPERLAALLNSKTRPVQFIFAGKAHPRDNEGKGLIRQIVDFARKADVRHRMIFVEDYDIHFARHLLHGADVWLNTPRRPFEACGTSGMKAAINGVLNLSILDGWWDEGYSPERGWRIGGGEEHADAAYQDAVESQALYNILENEVIPSFYDRENGGLPLRWIAMMKESMKMSMHYFCAHRMVAEYHHQFYLPAAGRYRSLVAEGGREARELGARIERLKRLWRHIRIDAVRRTSDDPFRVGESIDVAADVDLGDLRPEEVEVELYYGKLKTVESLAEGQVERMKVERDLTGGKYLYSCAMECRGAGRYGFTVRIRPKGDEWIKSAPGLITWA
jgi:glycogen phosphorylase